LGPCHLPVAGQPVITIHLTGFRRVILGVEGMLSSCRRIFVDAGSDMFLASRMMTVRLIYVFALNCTKVTFYAVSNDVHLHSVPENRRKQQKEEDNSNWTFCVSKLFKTLNFCSGAFNS
jgi:hypothetical protein